jgi:hypothetical protein
MIFLSRYKVVKEIISICGALVRILRSSKFFTADVGMDKEIVCSGHERGGSLWTNQDEILL